MCIKNRKTYDKCVVLLSGGVDSSTCLGIAVNAYGSENVKALSVHYGQRHELEIESAKKIAEYYDVTLDEIDLSCVMRFSNCSLLASSTEDIPEKSYAEQIAENGEGRVSTYVPFRNGLMLSAAASFADSVFPGKRVAILYGAHADDAAGNAYADCSQEFADAINKAIYIGTYEKIEVVTPFVDMNKSAVVEAGLSLSNPVPYNLTHSCYEGVPGGCGKCGTCIDRTAAFEANGLDRYGNKIED
jgi:7-cyano-7-deazaguanine synthase